jgi:hypothetical protein
MAEKMCTRHRIYSRFLGNAGRAGRTRCNLSANGKCPTLRAGAMEGDMKHLVWAAGFALLLLAAPAQAQSNRTWVSAVGDDVNPSSRTAPCKTFAGAFAKTNAFGTISVLDPGGYGQLVAVNKSISVITDGAQAGILVSGTDAITINAGPNDVVRLHGLFIESVAQGGVGIRIVSAGAVYIDHCSIRGFKIGISLDSAGATKVFLSDCSISLSDTGIQATQGQGEVVLDGVRLVRNQTAIYSKGNPTVFHLNTSVLADNKIAIGTVSGRILSSKTNAFSGNGSNGQAMAPEPLK